MNAPMDAGLGDDLSALAWVLGELRRSLEAAHKALRRHLKEAEALGGSDVDSVDPAVLRGARAQLHQGVGALELVGLPAPARLLRASEAAVQRMLGKPSLVNATAIDTIERASFALMDYLTRMLAGKPVSPVALFPQYRAAQALAGAERVHPADLWTRDYTWRDLPADTQATAREADDAARGTMETLVLALMRNPDSATLGRMSDLCADLGAGSRGPLATLWQLSAAFFEAQSHGLLGSDVYTKRIASRLLGQLRATVKGQTDLSERLGEDLLFFCAQARPAPAGQPVPRLDGVRRTWQLEDTPAADYETPRLGRFDPAWVAQARKRVAGAKDAWSAVAGGELHRLTGLAEQFSLVGDSLQRLFPSGQTLAAALQTAIGQAVSGGAAPAASLAMEVATALLYVDACLEDGDFDDPELAARVQRLAGRVDDVCMGAEPQPLEGWMEELYRRVSDRQTMGSVVQELRASLSEVEKQIDQYFRDPAQRQLLIPVPNQLAAMRGVLSVLGMDQASQAVLHMRDDVDALVETEVDPHQAVQAGTFDRLADNLGALSFLIDMLSVQPALAKSLFRFDPATGSLSAVMGQSERVSAFAAFDDIPGPPQPLPPAQDPPADFAPASLAAPPALHGGLEDDQEMRDIFIEEAREVVADARTSLDKLGEQADDLGEMTAIRRAFHTLKGSARMVGLRDYGDAAWSCEQLFNARLAHSSRMDHPLRAFTAEAVDYLGAWTEAIAAGQPGGHNAPAVARAADALRLEGRRVPIGTQGDDPGLPEAWPAPAPEPESESESESEAADDVQLMPLAAEDPPAFEPTAVPDDEPEPAFDFALDPVVEPDPRPALEVAAEAPAGALDFNFDLDPLPDAPAADATLLARVPGLPSAADLDLGFVSDLDLPGPARAPEPELPADESLAFELDLGDEPASAEPAWSVEPEAAAGPEVDVDPEPLPVAAAEAVELDLNDFDFGFPEPEPLEPAAEPPAVEPLPDTPPGIPFAGPLEMAYEAAFEASTAPAVEPGAEPEPVAAEAETAELPSPDQDPEPGPVTADSDDGDEQVRVIGDLRISIPLFNIFLNEADELSRRLCTELAEWALDDHERHPIGETAEALAHSLAGNSATVGHAELSALARGLEHAVGRSRHWGRGRAGEPALFNEVADEIRRLLHQFAAGFLRPAAPGLMERLAEHERWPAEPETTVSGALTPYPMPPAHAARDAELVDDDIDAEDAIDTDLFPIFEEEADELLPQLQARLRDWADRPADGGAPAACMRTLHTFKGGARLAGAMRLGEMAHRLETAIEELAAHTDIAAHDVDPLVVRADAMAATYDALRKPAPAAAMPAQPVAVEADPEPVAAQQIAAAEAPVAVQAQTPGAPSVIDWGRFPAAADGLAAPVERTAPAGSGAVRVRGGLLDRMINQAGEVSITRARIDTDVRQLQSSLNELTDSLDRMRKQLRDIELQAETQINTRMEAAKAAAEAFDPLEMDRFTRFQELTRFMAESVNDVATLQRSLQRTLQSTEDQLAAQGRLTRELQDDLLRTRMIEFESLAERLYRVVRQAAKDTGRQVRLDITGGAIEIDRGVLERMTGPFEHLLRNCVAHGIEAPDVRDAAGKDRTGSIGIIITQEGNEVSVEVRDDGAGLDLGRIRQRAIERGLIAADAAMSDAELAQLIFMPGFSTAQSVTELAGRGVGLDVVQAEVDAMGGRMQTASAPGQGTSFRLLLPLTTAVTQVVMLRCGELSVAVPSTLVEVVRRVPAAEIEQAYDSGDYTVGEHVAPFYWLASLLQAGTRGTSAGRTQPVVVIRSAAQRVALHVDEVVGNQEVVVKNVGPQLSRLPGLAGVTLLPSGAVALIYNPVALATLYGTAARQRMQQQTPDVGEPVLVQPDRPPLVLVVDDSLTVRRVTQRLLVREGYRVTTAKDGLDALERLAEERPVLMLSDIEMPRMDGFDLLRNVRAEPATAQLPVIMITSRTAAKHRDYAVQLGADHYLGKPYAEEELLALVARYAGADIPT